MDSDPQTLRRAYEALAQRVVEERLVFADRVQEVLDASQGAIADRDDQIRRLREDTEALRARIEELHRELVEAHENHRAVVESRSFRYTRPLRGFAKALHRG